MFHLTLLILKIITTERINTKTVRNLTQYVPLPVFGDKISKYDRTKKKKLNSSSGLRYMKHSSSYVRFNPRLDAENGRS